MDESFCVRRVSRVRRVRYTCTADGVRVGMTNEALGNSDLPTCNKSHTIIVKHKA